MADMCDTCQAVEGRSLALSSAALAAALGAVGALCRGYAETFLFLALVSLLVRRLLLAVLLTPIPVFSFFAIAFPSSL